MSKTKRRWVELDFTNPDSLRAQDIPYSASLSVKDAIDRDSAGNFVDRTGPDPFPVIGVDVVPATLLWDRGREALLAGVTGLAWIQVSAGSSQGPTGVGTGGAGIIEDGFPDIAGTAIPTFLWNFEDEALYVGVTGISQWVQIGSASSDSTGIQGVTGLASGGGASGLTGTEGFVPKFFDNTSIVDSHIYIDEDGDLNGNIRVGFDTTTPQALLDLHELNNYSTYTPGQGSGHIVLSSANCSHDIPNVLPINCFGGFNRGVEGEDDVYGGLNIVGISEYDAQVPGLMLRGYSFNGELEQYALPNTPIILSGGRSFTSDPFDSYPYTCDSSNPMVQIANDTVPKVSWTGNGSMGIGTDENLIPTQGIIHTVSSNDETSTKQLACNVGETSAVQGLLDGTNWTGAWNRDTTRPVFTRQDNGILEANGLLQIVGDTFLPASSPSYVGSGFIYVSNTTTADVDRVNFLFDTTTDTMTLVNQSGTIIQDGVVDGGLCVLTYTPDSFSDATAGSVVLMNQTGNNVYLGYSVTYMESDIYVNP